MRLEGFSMLAQSDVQRAFPVPRNCPRQFFAVSMPSENIFVYKRLEFGQLSEAIGPPGTCQLSSNDPSSR
jgi:hypothetical protein